MKPEVSVIMPVYNAPEFLDASISGIRNQTFPSFELICVDDGSDNPDTRTILERHAAADPRLSLIRLEHNGGAAGARNAGLEMARGTYVQFVDSDDLFAPNMLEEMHTAILEEEADICVCAHRTFQNDDPDTGETAQPNRGPRVTSGAFCLRDAGENGLCWWWDVPWNKLVRRELVAQNHILFQSLSSCNDGYYANMVVLLAERIVYTRTMEPLVFYRMNLPGQISASHDITNFYRFMKKILDERWKLAARKERIQLLFVLSESGLYWLTHSQRENQKRSLYDMIRGEMHRLDAGSYAADMSGGLSRHIRHFLDEEYAENWTG